MMRRRYEAYKDVVVRPFFRDHFARLDRQIVLVDALAAFNAGPEALHDLEAALAGILDCFRIGRSTLLQQPVPAADRPHPVRRHQGRSSASFEPRPAGGGAAADRGQGRRRAPNMPAPRSTSWRWPRCAPPARRRSQRGRDKLPSILGTPAPGEIANGETFDGNTEVATFPGDLPADPGGAVQRRRRVSRPLQRGGRKDRFPLSALPAAAARERGDGEEPALPHIRLDRALQFLIGDRLQ